MKINLIFFLANFSRGGAGNSIVNLSKNLDKNRYKIYLISLGENAYKNELKKNKNISIINLHCTRVLFSIFKLRKIVNTLQKKNTFKTIFVSNIHYTNIVSVLALKSFKNLKLIVVERTSIEELRVNRNLLEFSKKKIIIFLISILYKYSDKIISNSKLVAKDLKIITKKNVLVIHPPSIKKVLKLKKKYLSSKKQFIYIGRLSTEKGVDLIIKALSLLKTKNYILKIIGDGPQEYYLKKLTKKLKLNFNIKFLGFQNKTQKFYNSADLFINASYFEGLPNAIVESVNYGVPLICSDAQGGTLEVLKNGKIGYLFKAGDYHDLYNKILAYIKKPQILINKVNSHRQDLHNYTLLNNVKKYSHLFEKV